MFVRRAAAEDRVVLERLWLMFRHDMSEFQGQLPLPDGGYRSEWLEKVLTGDPDWAGYLFFNGENPIGFCFMRALTQPVRVLNAFFMVRPMRRNRLGLRAVQEVLAHHPGQCDVAFQDNNEKAVRFWQRVATEVSGDVWTREHRTIPSKPDATPDSWISFKV
ncbi:GNAT family N-acetyltransferase [Kribbella capetownensis]|uniref:GNAT family N-acetyltransferase n=1 Tax=Kribbella capetownensis TaxID=1572659 RepID=A0A4R0JUA3_9ACTN|nr:GNAT family N-acetyltransferase [Kribbella capetownensis]TCC51013.1 GNAT family N-acetyltransferase [Kribbella capetownensis]